MANTNTLDISIASTAGLASIVIPCCGMLEYTKLCVPSVLMHTRPPFELIFLDVGSLDGTAEYLAGLQAGLAGEVRVEIVRADTDLDLKDACREALRLTLGEYVVLLNNDTVVTPVWLNKLVAVANFSVGIGLAGPMSNMAPMAQLVETVPYRTFSSLSKNNPNPGGALVDVAEVERFAEKYAAENKKNWIHAERLGGFCVLVRREVLDKIGKALDEWADLDLFDSDILSAKARQVGYSLAVCRDLFVHHFRSREFAQGANPALAAGAAAR